MLGQDVTNAPMWQPSHSIINNSNIYRIINELELTSVGALQRFSTENPADFWKLITQKLNIHFSTKPTDTLDISHGVESPVWFPNAQLNIASSCFLAAASATAIHYLDKHDHLCQMTFGELEILSNQVANGLLKAGYQQGDAIAIAMPMNQYAIAIYLGIIKMGGVVVSIADSFSTAEMKSRCGIANAKGIFTQDVSIWNGKAHPLYAKVADAGLHQVIVINEHETNLSLRQQDIRWDDFISADQSFTPVAVTPMTPCNILFSSGTTSTPKAIVWNHTTPIKCASDAYLHHNIKAGDVLAWPTNLGWMMGPWLIFAALINKASLALYTEVPKDKHFGEFIQAAGVTMLGVVPTLVANWRKSACMEGLNWSRINVFSSTGECSNANDMRYLSTLAGGKPVIEYCGGTEIGGAYLTSTVIENNYPAQFTTPAMGIHLYILDEHGKPAMQGEVAIKPPSIGLSTVLLNKNHHEVYYQDMPTIDGMVLRRHGDEIAKLENGNYCIMGRSDDAMNLGGIKVSSAEIERTITGLPDITEVAAIAISPEGNGPSQLVIFAVSDTKPEIENTIKTMQKLINANLNPLFKIHDLIYVDSLPRTASNKVMRRVLRDKYSKI